MKKYLFWMLSLTGTFSIGIGACVFYYFRAMPIVAGPDSPTVKKEIGDLNSKRFPGLSREISKIRVGKSDYFPRDLFGNEFSPKNSQAGWYANQLSAMGEKSLLAASDDGRQIYRFLWLRTFHHPVFVRIEHRNQYKFELFTKELDGAGGYEPGKPLRSGNFNLDKDQWREFLTLLDKADYWKMPTENEDLLGNDGAQWVLEGVKDSRYHIVDRWSPREGAYREACIYLLKVSGIDVDKLQDDLY